MVLISLTRQDLHQFYINPGGEKRFAQIYGNPGDADKFRKRGAETMDIPEQVLAVYHLVSNYQNPDAVEWMPSHVEVLLLNNVIAFFRIGKIKCIRNLSMKMELSRHESKFQS